MHCCVPFCENSSDNDNGITFHGLPSEGNLRTAWLRALGTQDHHLPDPAVVCSQHFLEDDFYETKSSVRQIHSHAIPSTVQVSLVCMICLDTGSKLSLMSKHKLEEAYEQLTGLSLCGGGNLKQTLCVLCAQRLINFSTFRDLCLRSHTLMTDLVEQHEFITLLHKQLMSHATKQLKCNLTQTTLAADHCDLYIDHTDGEEQTAAEKSVVGDVAVVVKNENSPDSMSSADNLELVHEDDNQRDNSNSDCASDDEYSDMIIQLKSELLDEATTGTAAPLSTRLAANNNTKVQATEEAGVTQKSEQILETNIGGLDNKSSQSGTKTYTDINKYTNCVVQLYDIFKTLKKPVLNENPGGKTQNGVKPYCCEICNCKFAYKQSFLKHKIIHTVEKPYSCETCNYKCAVKRYLVIHKRTHTGEKPYSCETCNFKCANKNYLVKHIRIHTGEKPYCCEICGCRFSQINHLSSHISTHTGVKPYSCEMCTYKCARKSSLLIHKRTHSTVYTGTKPYSCDLCNYKCAIKSYLLIHKRIHTGEKPYCCQICNYKCAQKTDLIIHKRTHTGKKPYSCEICNYKCAHKSNLTRHRRTHTGEKPYSCGLCNYKCATKSYLLIHKKTHTGEKPYSCDLCNYKCAKKSYLLIHKRTHTGDKPYCCEICGYKFAHKSSFTQHIKTHIGEKLYSCEICNYNTARKSNLLRHIKTHTGRKPITSMKKKNYLQKTIISG
ncbi:zinc finger protein 300 isoform X2 [Bicyclus anynana]|uniref:Zinc finger protein 300 isoform X2 n=1 Tax=Bicyclus anynana TaxID=110368 RepID=A0ABM3M3P3_BICAN|nr:zinc finger protein 300 isoform X2 [Bicyclus anynana]